ncbi:uncharacterized protein LOC128200739 [Galleria mellonella]|uniref:Uncharacterized protein LOC128200739 n=1 Tax=Galleria mellonella TaxID=7137 RepID=A0ABM3MI27_GALME|nr:uncharacterized protein LOC128200739 [Galleria mellonella]
MEHFDYELLKVHFYKLVSHRFKNNSIVRATYPWSRISYDGLITVIERCKAKSKEERKKTPFTTFELRVLAGYDILFENGRKKLILKRKSATDPILKVIPDDESFDLIALTHIENNHCNQEKLLQLLIKNYSINIMCVEIFFQLHTTCHCNNPVKKKSVNFYDECYISIIDLRQYFDDPFNYIIMLVDKVTGFAILRPIVNITETYLTIEFMKIFTTFGAPRLLRTSNHLALHTTAMNRVNKLCGDFDVVVTACDDSNLSRHNKKVILMLKEWIVSSNSRSWAAAIQMLQWQLNNAPDDVVFRGPENRRVVPYIKVFNHHCNYPLNATPTWTKVEHTGKSHAYLDALIEKIISTNTVSEVNEIMSDVDNSDSDDTILKCFVCHHEISNKKTCKKCMKHIHEVCSQISVVNGNLEFVCTLCAFKRPDNSNKSDVP